MDKVIPALFVAAISSLTFIAYKHPNAYRKLQLPLVVSGFIIILAVSSWDWGGDFTFQALIKYIEVDKLKEAAAIADSYKVSPWWMTAIATLNIYFLALSYLPRLLDEDKPENK
jgi:hypothetical protein